MFKNRIRTAAIAGIAALATGVTGTVVAAPAFAQDQVVDGAQATDVAAANYSDGELARANSALRDDIRDIQDTEAYENYVVDREAFLEGEYDQSEEALAAEYDALRADVEAALAQAVANVNTARAAVKDAENKDNAVRGALDAYGEAAAALSNLLTDADRSYTEIVEEDGVQNVTTTGLTATGVLNEYLNDFDLTPIDADGIADLDQFSYTINGETVSPLDTNIVDYDQNVVRVSGNDGQIDGLQVDLETLDPANSADQDKIGTALTSIEDLVEAVAADTDDSYLGQLEIAREALNDLKTNLEEDGYVDVPNDDEQGNPITNPVDVRTSEAQAAKIDAALAYLDELEADIEAAVAAVETAKEAYDDAAWAATGANYASRSRALQDATSQRNALRGLNGYLIAAERYTELYNDDILAGNSTLRQQFYDAFETTRFNLRVDENGDGVGFASETIYGAGNLVKRAIDDVLGGANIGTLDQMLNEFGRLELVEQAVADEAAADKAAADRDQAIIDKLTGSDEAEEDGNGSTGNENIGGGSSFEAPSFGGGSSDLGGFGIAAVIAAIIGVLALVVPNIQNFL